MTFGAHGSIHEHRLYLQESPRPHRRKCHCGCEAKQTHMAMANGVALAWGCELTMRRFIKTGGASLFIKTGGDR